MRSSLFAGCALLVGCAWVTPIGADSVEGAKVVDGVEWQELLPNARRPAPHIVSGGQPSAEQLAAAQDAGFRTVVNLRGKDEPGAKGDDVEALGMEYMAFPIASDEDLNEANAKTFASLLDKVEGPILLHCGSGNRVGALFALAAFYEDGVAAEEALEKGLASGLTGLEPVVRQRLGLASQ